MIQFATAYYFVTWDELHRVTSVEEFHSQIDQIVRDFACEDCRKHFQELVSSHPIPLEKVTTLEEAKLWYWLSHNLINIRIGKDWEPLNVLDKYENSCSNKI